jgi:hypothetical protein
MKLATTFYSIDMAQLEWDSEYTSTLDLDDCLESDHRSATSYFTRMVDTVLTKPVT